MLIDATVQEDAAVPGRHHLLHHEAESGAGGRVLPEQAPGLQVVVGLHQEAQHHLPLLPGARRQGGRRRRDTGQPGQATVPAQGGGGGGGGEGGAGVLARAAAGDDGEPGLRAHQPAHLQPAALPRPGLQPLQVLPPAPGLLHTHQLRPHQRHLGVLLLQTEIVIPRAIQIIHDTIIYVLSVSIMSFFNHFESTNLRVNV